MCEEFRERQQAANIDQSPPREMSLQEMEDLKQHYLDEILSLSNDLQIKDYRNEKIDIRFRRECEDMIDELKGKFNGTSIKINKKKELQYLEQVPNLSTYPSQSFKSFCYDDDDYEESTIPLNEIDSQTPSSIEITPVLPTLEPEDSLIMGDKELCIIPEKKSDEFIKSSVEDLVPIPSESEDTFGSDSDCDLPSCGDFSPINVYGKKSVTFSNPLFDSNDDFTSSNDESLSDEDVPEDNVKIYSNPLFEFDDEYISSDVNPLFDEVLEDIECMDSYDSNFDELTFLSLLEYDLFLFEVELDQGRLISIVISINSNDPLLEFSEFESFHFDPSFPRPPSKPPNVEISLIIETNEPVINNFDELNEDECFNPGGDEIDVENDDSFTFVIQTFLPFLTYPEVSPLLFSTENEDTIFDPGIST
ncbi:hypothetical protein Tco_0717036 [Tanacetum coccineum]